MTDRHVWQGSQKLNQRESGKPASKVPSDTQEALELVTHRREQVEAEMGAAYRKWQTFQPMLQRELNEELGLVNAQLTKLDLQISQTRRSQRLAVRNATPRQPQVAPATKSDKTLTKLRHRLAANERQQKDVQEEEAKRPKMDEKALLDELRQQTSVDDFLEKAELVKNRARQEETIHDRNRARLKQLKAQHAELAGQIEAVSPETQDDQPNIAMSKADNYEAQLVKLKAQRDGWWQQFRAVQHRIWRLSTSMRQQELAPVEVAETSSFWYLPELLVHQSGNAVDWVAITQPLLTEQGITPTLLTSHYAPDAQGRFDRIREAANWPTTYAMRNAYADYLGQPWVASPRPVPFKPAADWHVHVDEALGQAKYFNASALQTAQVDYYDNLQLIHALSWYQNNRLEKRQIFDRNGLMQAEQHFDDSGQTLSLQRFFDSSGRVRISESYHLGELTRLDLLTGRGEVSQTFNAFTAFERWWLFEQLKQAVPSQLIVSVTTPDVADLLADLPEGVSVLLLVDQVDRSMLTRALRFVKRPVTLIVYDEVEANQVRRQFGDQYPIMISQASR